VAPFRRGRRGSSENRGGNNNSELSLWADPFSDPFISGSPFGSMFGELARTGAGDLKFPEVDISRTDTGLKIEANCPGYSKDQVNIDVDGRWITISGQKNEETEKDENNYHVQERRSGSFSRRFHLPDDAKLDEIQAKLDNGVLEIGIPTEQEAQSQKKKKIDIA